MPGRTHPAAGPKALGKPSHQKREGGAASAKREKKEGERKTALHPPPPHLHPLPPFTLTGNDAPRRSHEGRRVGRPVGERGGGRAQAARAPAAAAHCLDVPPLSRRRGAGGGRRAARRPGLGRGGRGPGERGGPRAAIPGQAGRGGRGEGGGAAQRRRGQRDNRAAQGRPRPGGRPGRRVDRPTVRPEGSGRHASGCVRDDEQCAVLCAAGEFWEKRERNSAAGFVFFFFGCV